jgi:hypothetical protein
MKWPWQRRTTAPATTQEPSASSTPSIELDMQTVAANVAQLRQQRLAAFEAAMRHELGTAYDELAVTIRLDREPGWDKESVVPAYVQPTPVAYLQYAQHQFAISGIQSSVYVTRHYLEIDTGQKSMSWFLYVRDFNDGLWHSILVLPARDGKLYDTLLNAFVQYTD